MSFKHITLPDDPAAALEEIAAYLDAIRRDGGRAVWYGAEGKIYAGAKRHPQDELASYWQTVDWLDGLIDIGKECRRIAAKPMESFARFYLLLGAILGLVAGVSATLLFYAVTR